MEAEFLTASGVLLGTGEHLDKTEMQELCVELFADEALKTSGIEGEFLNRDSIQYSIRRQFGLSADPRNIPAAEQGIAAMTVDAYRTWSEPLAKEMLFGWHRELVKGRHDISEIGRYRTGDKPMQVVSGMIGSGHVRFEAPPSAAMESEMNLFLKWFNCGAEAKGPDLSALTRSGIAHLWFVSIHPFEDGNGRIGRAVAEKALAQTQGRPSLTALAHTIEKHRKDYYGALEAVNHQLEITEWLVWFAKTVLEAQEYSIQRVRFVIEKAKFYGRHGGELNARQAKVVARIFKEGASGFEGGLSAENYIRIAKTSASTATRDLQDLVAKGVLSRTGERRHARYELVM